MYDNWFIIMLRRILRYAKLTKIIGGFVRSNEDAVLNAIYKLINNIPEKVTFVDVGANVGQTSEAVVLAHSDRLKRLVLVEPNPNSAAIASVKIMNLIDSDHTSFELHELAIGGKEGVLSLCVPDDTVSQNCKLENMSDDECTDAKIPVRVEMLENFLASNNIKNALLKIDCEGEEVNILSERCLNYLWSNQEIMGLVVEVHFSNIENAGKDIRVLTNILENSMFKVEWIDYSHVKLERD